MCRSQKKVRVTPAIIWRENILVRGCVQFDMPVTHSSKDVELRTGNTGLKFMEDVWADDFKTLSVDEITQGVSINGKGERSFHRSFQVLGHYSVKRSGR